MDKRIELANLCNFSRSSQQLEPEEDEGISSLILKGGFNWSQGYVTNEPVVLDLRGNSVSASHRGESLESKDNNFF